MNIQKIIREIVEKEGPALALQWGKELREDRAEMKKKQAKEKANVNKDRFAHH